MDNCKEYLELLRKVVEEIPYIGVRPYSHNIISLNLRIIEQKFGTRAVEAIIEMTDLKDLGWGYIINC